MYCNQCGTQLPEDADFCPMCGARVPRRKETFVQPVTAPVRGRNTIVIGAIAAVTIVLIACIICFTIMTQRNQDAQLAAIQSAQSSEQADGAQNNTAQQSDATADQTEDSANSADSKQSTVTNNYYYYGSGSSHDNEYYTQSLNSGYLWPTDSQYISASDLSGLSEDTVSAIRNEIYARHGYAFTTERWQDYFASKTWYTRDATCTDSTVKARLSSIERANISTIVAYEEAKGWR